MRIGIALIAFILSLIFIKTKSRLSMQITENFRLGEFVSTSTGLFNYPDKKGIERIVWTAKNVMQPLRNRFGAIKITSGYRSPAVNEKVGGVKGSAHTEAGAVDIVPLEYDIKNMFEEMQALSLPIKKALLSETDGTFWIHLEPDFDGNSEPVYLVDAKPGAGYEWT